MGVFPRALGPLGAQPRVTLSSTRDTSTPLASTLRIESSLDIHYTGLGQKPREVHHNNILFPEHFSGALTRCIFATRVQ